MAMKTKGRAGWRQATLETYDSCNPTPAASAIKALIVRLALWGFIPLRLAVWVIHRFNLGAA